MDTGFFVAKGCTSREGWCMAQFYVLSGRKSPRLTGSSYIYVKGIRNKTAKSIVAASRRFCANVGIPFKCFLRRLAGTERVRVEGVPGGVQPRRQRGQ